MGWLDKDGYVRMMNGKGTILEHRYVWLQYNGPVPKGMHIHHINGIRTDNRIENLMVIDESTHYKIHAGYQLIDGVWWKKCCECGELKQLNDDFGLKYTGKGIYNAWCRDCRNRYMKAYNEKRRSEMTQYCRQWRIVEKLHKGIDKSNLLHSYLNNTTKITETI